MVQIGNGKRSNAAASYIAPALDRKTLDVLVNTVVTRVLHSGTQNGEPVFRTVEFAQSASSEYPLFLT